MFSRPLSSLPIPLSTKTALQRAGFETISDLGNLNAEQLSRELSLPSFVCEDLLSNARLITPIDSRPVTALLDSTPLKVPICDVVDDLLGGGGLKKGSVLELSGPPGCPKERVVLDLVRSFVNREEGVIFVDMQNMLLNSALSQELEDLSRATELVRYMACHSLTQLLVFFHGLPFLLEREAKITLIALNSLSFAMHTTVLPHSVRNSLLDQIKGVLARLCTSRQITVVTTVQMATKLLSVDGNQANHDTGKKAVLVPQLGESYLPAGRSYRLVFVPDSPITGVVRILSSPSAPEVGSQGDTVQRSYIFVSPHFRNDHFPH